MTREMYIMFLRENKLGSILYMYYVEMTGVILEPQDFSELLSDYLGAVAVRYLLDSDSLLEVCENIAIQYFDKKYNIVYAVREETFINAF